MENRYEEILKSLQGETLKEKYDDLLNKDFMLNMKDKWDSEDRAINSIYQRIEKELQEKMEEQNG